MAAGTSPGRMRAVALPRVGVRLLVGLALVAIAMVGGLSLWRQAQITSPVIVAARAIPPGHVIERTDLALAQARLEGALAALAFGEHELDAVIGRTAAGAIHAGALVLQPDLGSGPVIGPEELAVTVPVQADAVYPRLRRGDAVAVIATSDQGKPQSLTVTLLERATVLDVALESSRVSLGAGDDTVDDGRPTNVTLVIARAEAERVAHAVVNAELTVLLLAPASPPGSAQ